jgi:transposase
MVVQMESEAARNLALEKRNAELERIIGQKQLQLDYYEKLISVASAELDMDIKKNFDGPSLISSSAKSKQGDGQ